MKIELLRDDTYANGTRSIRERIEHDGKEYIRVENTGPLDREETPFSITWRGDQTMCFDGKQWHNIYQENVYKLGIPVESVCRSRISEEPEIERLYQQARIGDVLWTPERKERSSIMKNPHISEYPLTPEEAFPPLSSEQICNLKENPIPMPREVFEKLWKETKPKDDTSTGYVTIVTETTGPDEIWFDGKRRHDGEVINVSGKSYKISINEEAMKKSSCTIHFIKNTGEPKPEIETTSIKVSDILSEPEMEKLKEWFSKQGRSNPLSVEDALRISKQTGWVWPTRSFPTKIEKDEEE